MAMLWHMCVSGWPGHVLKLCQGQEDENMLSVQKKDISSCILERKSVVPDKVKL